MFFKWQKSNPKPYPRSKRNQMYPAQVFTLKQKHLALKLVNFIKRPTEDKVDNMGQSAKKRIDFKSRPKSKKTQLKFAKRMAKNNQILNKLK